MSPGVASHKTAAQAVDAGSLSTHPARTLASVLSRPSPSQFGSGPGKHDAPLGRKLDGLPLTDKVVGFMSARLAKPIYAFCSPSVLDAGAPRMRPVESRNCVSDHSAAAVVSSLIVMEVESDRLLNGPSAAIRPIAELTPWPASPPVAVI